MQCMLTQLLFLRIILHLAIQKQFEIHLIRHLYVRQYTCDVRTKLYTNEINNAIQPFQWPYNHYTVH